MDLRKTLVEAVLVPVAFVADVAARPVLAALKGATLLLMATRMLFTSKA